MMRATQVSTRQMFTMVWLLFFTKIEMSFQASHDNGQISLWGFWDKADPWAWLSPCLFLSDVKWLVHWKQREGTPRPSAVESRTKRWQRGSPEGPLQTNRPGHSFNSFPFTLILFSPVQCISMHAFIHPSITTSVGSRHTLIRADIYCAVTIYQALFQMLSLNPHNNPRRQALSWPLFFLWTLSHLPKVTQPAIAQHV